jgi:hypothetical protein
MINRAPGQRKMKKIKRRRKNDNTTALKVHTLAEEKKLMRPGADYLSMEPHIAQLLSDKRGLTGHRDRPGCSRQLLIACAASTRHFDRV